MLTDKPQEHIIDLYNMTSFSLLSRLL